MSDSLPIYAVADLHLASGKPEKRMDEFGAVWANHPKRLFANWRTEVPEDALVLCPGDLSWGMRLPEILADWQLIARQNGQRIVLSPGNHDYAIFRTTAFAQRNAQPLEKLLPIKFGAVRFESPGGERGVVIACARGSLAPGDPWFAKDPGSPESIAEATKEYDRELTRMTTALEEASRLRCDEDALIVCSHYPPFDDLTEANAYSELIERAGADICVFGHLHNDWQHEKVFQGMRGTTRYALVACDALDMHPLKLGELTDDGLRIDLPAVRTGLEVTQVQAVRSRIPQNLFSWHEASEL